MVVNVKKIWQEKRKKPQGLRLIHTGEFGDESGRRKNIELQVFKTTK